MDHLAAGEHDLHAQHVVARHAVANGAHAAGVGHRVAAHGRGLLARIRRVEQARALQRLGEFHEQNARLDRRGHVAGVHLKDLFHLFSREHHAAVDRHAAAAKARARAARGDGDVMLAAVAEHRTHVLGTERLQNRLRHVVAVLGHFVMVVVGGDVLPGKHAARQELAEVRDIRCRHFRKRLHACPSFSCLIRLGTIS